MEFEATYYDGKSSKGQKAYVRLISKELLIFYHIDNEVFTIRWEADKIKKNVINRGGVISLMYGQFPHESIEVKDPSFFKAYTNQYNSSNFIAKSYHFVISKGNKGALLLILFLVAFLTTLYFVIIPNMAEQIANHLLPKSFEEELGERFYEGFISNDDIDSNKTLAVNKYFKKLNYQPSYNIKITVIKKDEINAFALPGGRMVIFTGILEKLSTHEELAALIGHELTHIEMKHSTKSLCRSLSSYMLISVIMGDVGGISALLIENANMLQNLGYSRTLEKQADEDGLQLMIENHIDPKGILLLLQKLNDNHPEQGKYLKYLQTHPMTQVRIENIKRLLKNRTLKTLKNPYLEALAKPLLGNKNNDDF